MRYFLLFIYFFLSFFLSYSQYNLVPNYSFETYTKCPSYNNNPPPTPWHLACQANNPVYLNSCSADTITSVPNNYVGEKSYQVAKTGNAYLGFAYFGGGDLRLYIGVKLKDSLQKNKKYYCEYYVSQANTTKFASNNIAMLLTNKAVYPDTVNYLLGVLPANPQIINYGNPIIEDTLNWIKISGIYNAKGGEQFITLGNFKDDVHTNKSSKLNPQGINSISVYYVDDVSVIPLDSFCLQANAGRDTTIKQGDSVFIGSYSNGIDTIKWYNAAGQVIDSLQPGFWVKPSITGNYMYMVEQTVNGCFSRDTMYVNVLLPLNFLNYNVILRNEKSVENIWATASEINVSNFNIQRSKNGKDFTTIAQQKAQNKALNNYSYTDETIRNEQQETWFYRIESIDNDGKKSYSEIKKVSINQLPYQSISIYPNPAKTYVNITGSNIKFVQLLNAFGAVLKTQNANFNTATIALNKLSSGLYFIKIIDSNNKITTKKIYKE
jgi:Secretion system C-terminal sorting domain